MEDQLVEVTSPLPGIVVDIEREAGERVEPRDGVVTVHSTGMRVVVEAGVPGVVRDIETETGPQSRRVTSCSR
jgi:biotin carboxyl carrier protein